MPPYSECQLSGIGGQTCTRGCRREMKIIAIITLGTLILLCLSGLAQSPNRFPSPLGLDRVLVGVVVDCAAKDAPGTKAKHRRDSRCEEDNGYVLAVDQTTYALRGHEEELRQRVGTTVRITGKAVGREVEVHSVEAAEK
jgi:hypothetical protein